MVAGDLATVTEVAVPNPIVNVASTTSIEQQGLTESSNFHLQESAGQLVGDLRQQTNTVAAPTNNAVFNEAEGLRFFQSGLQDLYKKSMMAAGFSQAEVSDSSQVYHRFAFQAWKNECERLQGLLQGHVDD